jgi:hypothetical protein
MSLPQVPPQLKTPSGGYFFQLYLYLVKLVAAIASSSGGGATVRGSLVTDGAGHITVAPGATGIAGVALVSSGGSHAVQVTFSAAFANANYVWGGNWFATSPGVLPVVLGNLGVAAADPRLAGSVTFVVYNAFGETDPSSTALTVMFTAQ